MRTIDRDRTKQKAGKRRVEEFQDQLIQMNDILPPREFIPNLFHRLNNPFSSIIGYSQLLLSEMADANTKEMAEKIIEEAKRASQVTKNLSAYMRTRRLRRETIDVNEVVNTLLESKSRELNLKHIKLVKKLAPFVPLIKADRQQIQNVLLNVINNAEEAISKFHGSGEIRVKTMVRKDQVLLIVSDNGPGITEGNLSNIFYPFFTTKEDGMGLGLASSYDVIMEHGGIIEVESESGKGAAFRVILPLTDIKEGREKKGGEAGESLKDMKGLVIDDEPSITRVVYEYLKGEGCEMKTAADVKTALDMLGENSFDFVVCDIKMPEMGGSEFHQIIKEMKPLLLSRIIYCTGDVPGMETKAFVDSVNNPVIEKPFNLNELKEVVVKVVNKDQSSAVGG